jgi:nicotinamidase-related amidase
MKRVERSSDPGAAPSDWETNWNKPHVWPKPPGAQPVGIAATAEAHRHYRPNLSECALVLIDVDKKAFDNVIEGRTAHDAQRGRSLASRTYRTVVPNLIRLVAFFRKRKRPVIFVQWGWHRYQYPPLEPRKGESVVIKQTRGAFGKSSLNSVLRRLRIKTCIFAGADTAWCVASTVRGAIDHGYRAVLVEDACFCAEPQMHNATIMTLGWNQAHILSTKQVLALGEGQSEPHARP